LINKIVLLNSNYRVYCYTFSKQRTSK